jgi:hypothetical protein
MNYLMALLVLRENWIAMRTCCTTTAKENEMNGQKDSRPRLANSAVYLRDAHDSGLSAHSRFRCAFESIYFCCCELAESHGIGLDGLTHPSVGVVDAGLTALHASSLEREVVEQLTEWANNASPFVPPVSMDDACRLAEQINTATISFFARRGPAAPVEA